MKLSGAEIIIKLLENEGIEVISGIPGGMNLPMYNALYKSRIKHILARHEQGAGFIAQGIARSTGKPAVCFATSGPGSTNLITAIADAKLDSVPLIAITGQVSSSLIGTDAFQEADIYGMTIPITKHNFLIRNIDELFSVIPSAFHIATEGRPGPVLIDIPKDIQTQITEWKDVIPQNAQTHLNTPSIDILQQTADIINSGQRPVLYVGGGAIQSDAHSEILELMQKSSIPATSSLMGLGCIPKTNPLFLGMLGMHGSEATNRIIHKADVLIALGVRFDDRATGLIKQFCPNAQIIHIDIDASELSKVKPAHIEIHNDIKETLTLLLPFIHGSKRTNWTTEIEAIKRNYPNNHYDLSNPYHPVAIIKSISELTPRDTIITTDVGQHQMWTAQSYPFVEPRTFLTSGGLGTMGFGLPVAIGAALANPGRKVVCFTGDGSILMNIQELATLAELNLNISIFVFNNGHLGLVRQQQELFYDGNYIASKFMKNTDYPAIAKGFGIESFNLNGVENPTTILAKVLQLNGPALVNIPINPSILVTPMVPPGKANIETRVA